MKKYTKLTFQFFWFTSKTLAFGAACFSAMTLGTFGDMYFYYLFKDFINALSAGASEQTLLMFVLGIGSVQLFNVAMWRVGGYSASVFEPKAMKEMTNHCFEVLHKHSYNFFNNQFVGSLVKRISRMARSFEDITDQMLFEFYPLLLRTLIAIAVLYFISPWLGIALFIWSVLFIFIHYRISLYAMDRYDIPKAQADSKVVAYLADTITNNSTIKFFANLSFEKKAFDEVSGRWTKIITSAWFFRNHVEAIQAVMMTAIQGLILVLAVKLWSAGELTVGDFVLIQSYLWTVFIHLWDFGRLIRRLYESMADAEEMTEILNTPFEVVDKPKARVLRVLRGNVEFDKVSFSYNEDDEASVLRIFLSSQTRRTHRFHRSLGRWKNDACEVTPSFV